MKYPGIDIEATPKQGGFTLMELMIVVAIVAILAAVAIPSYRQHTIKSNRAAAESFMMQIANKEEQYILDARNYTGTIGTGGLNLTAPSDVNANYQITVNVNNAASPPTYTITATPKNPPQNDPLCGNLTLDQSGSKGAQLGTPQTCW